MYQTLSLLVNHNKSFIKSTCSSVDVNTQGSTIFHATRKVNISYPIEHANLQLSIAIKENILRSPQIKVIIITYKRKMRYRCIFFLMNTTQ